MSDLVGNHENRFSHNEAHIIMLTCLYNTGFPLHFEIEGTLALFPYFCTPHCIEAYLFNFGGTGTSQILGVKKLVEGKLEC